MIDTHALIWFLENNPLLGKRAKEYFNNPSSTLLIPVVVLAELYFYLKKKKLPHHYTTIYSSLKKDPRVEFVSITEKHILNIPPQLEMHDGLIAAILTQDQNTKLISKDKKLIEWDKKRIVW